MQTSTISNLKKQLSTLDEKDIVAICLRLAKYKKENKELLHYLLFEAHDEAQYIEAVKTEMDEQFTALNQSQLYLAKKTLRKVLRTAAKHIKYSGNPQTEVELLLHFCTLYREISPKLKKQTILQNMYARQVQKIKQALGKLHEDLQYDYRDALNDL